MKTFTNARIWKRSLQVLFVFTFVLFAALPMDANAKQNYLLKAGSVQSTATFDGSNLVIFEGSVGYSYGRMEALDSSDGQFLGFHNRTLDKTIRFPIAGNARIQIEGAYNNWTWSQMTVTRLGAVIASPVERAHELIDEMALSIQQLAEQLATEARVHYRHTPEYDHLVADTRILVRESAHLHDLAHAHGRLDQMAADLVKLDSSYHHLEETFDRIEANAAHGAGIVLGQTSHVKELLNSMETALHQVQQIVAALQPRQNVLKPNTFGMFANIGPLAHRLETLSNELLLDLHHNYSHNRGFNETYAEAYELLTAAQFVHTAEHTHSHAAIQQKLDGLDRLLHHVEDDVQGWHATSVVPLAITD